MISCKEYVEREKNLLKEKIKKYYGKPSLTVIQVGDNPASNSYIAGKRKDCEEVGIRFQLIKLNEDVSVSIIGYLIDKLNDDNDVDGIILQLPLPPHLKDMESCLTKSIKPQKDVDGFNPDPYYFPCTPEGVIGYLKDNDYDFCGKNALVIGRSNIVGKPLSKMLLKEDCTVATAHSKTKSDSLQNLIQWADIIFTCIDKVEFFKQDNFSTRWLKKDIIDIGLGRNEEGKLRGNISKDFADNLKMMNKDNVVISGIGGIGLLTRLELLRHTFEAHLLNNNLYL